MSSTKQRFRSRTFSYTRVGHTYSDPPSSAVYEQIQEVRVAKNRSNVRHCKTISTHTGDTGPFINGYRRFQTEYFYPANLVEPLLFGTPGFMAQLNSAFSSMASPPDSYQDTFEIIPFIADLDSTISSWVNRFLLGKPRDFKQLAKNTGSAYSYGAWEWDILPFIADLKNLFTSLRDIMSSGAGYAQCMPINRKRVISFYQPHDTAPSNTYGDYYLSQVIGYATYRGAFYYTPPDMSDLFQKAFFLLDEIGFHPDLKTAWDIVPLSFVVDYFLPLGDILESIHPRGWRGNRFRWDGFTTYKLDVTTAFSYRPSGSQLSVYAPTTCRYYSRTWNSDFLPPTKPVVWSAPSLRQLFNTNYLLSSLWRSK
jgi:hypothetical protein